MMTSSVVNLVQAKHNATTEELTNMLEALPSSENSHESREASAIFDDENEPSSGLINLIRKNSVRSSQTITTADSSNTVRVILIERFFGN